MRRNIMGNIINWRGYSTKDFFFENCEVNDSAGNTNFAFSIVVAVYNSGEYVAETIESILNQDFDFSRIQLVLVDDGSTDNSYDICKSYALSHPNNIILIHKDNGGVSSARNVGLSFATGKYINFLDSDDKFGENVCSEVYKFFETNQNRTDVVTIKVKIFGDKTGESWYNKKFDKGNRIINLFNEPAVYLNSTNSTFFHRRIKNQLHFDEELSIAEDLKVVNTVLMNKYTLGVINSCLYYYRIRSNGSLVSTARNKDVYYLTYLERVYFWLYEKSIKQTGRFLEFLQYTLLRELYNRLNNNTECITVLKDNIIIDIYKSTLFRALFLIDDKIIKKCGFINTDFMLYIFSKKYGKPSLVFKDNKLHFVWSNRLEIEKKLYAAFELCSVSKEELVLEGYAIINNIQYEHNEYNLLFSLNDEYIHGEIIDNTNNDQLAFADEFVFYRKYFKLRIKKPTSKCEVILWLRINDVTVPYQLYGFDKWFGLDKNVDGSYYYNRHFLLTNKNGHLFVQQSSSIEALKHELVLLLKLKRLGKVKSNYHKAYLLRLYYWVSRFICRRPIWIISDRCISAGDNGEAFYSFVRKKRWINSYFAINHDSTDYARLKECGYKVLSMGTMKYKIKYLLSDKVISAHFDHSELYPLSTPCLNDIKAKKMHVFLQHGITKDDVSRFYSRKKQKIDRFIVAANPEYESIINNRNYFCDDENVRLTGFPRYDKLQNAPEKVILVMPTWRNSLVSFDINSKDAVVNKEFAQSNYYIYYHELLCKLGQNQWIKDNGYRIEYFPHFNMIATNSYFADIPNVDIVEGAARDYNKTFARAAIMITDYSSTAFDFAYLRKPIIYCQGDSDDFFKHHTYTKGYFDYENDGFGKVTKDVHETLAELERILRQGSIVDEMYLMRINSFFKFNDRNNCARVFKEIKGKI